MLERSKGCHHEGIMRSLQEVIKRPLKGIIPVRRICCFTMHVTGMWHMASSSRLSGIGMPSPVLWSHPLKMQRIVLLSSLLWWELGTNSLITGPGEWLSFRRFTSKLSWYWSCSPSGTLPGIICWSVPVTLPQVLWPLLLLSEIRLLPSNNQNLCL